MSTLQVPQATGTHLGQEDSVGNTGVDRKYM